MDDFTRVNLKEVEDLAPRFGLSPALESRFARTALGLRVAGLSDIYVRIHYAGDAASAAAAGNYGVTGTMK